MDLNKKEFESKCIEVIESIILSNIKYTRTDAINISAKMIAKAKEKNYPTGVIEVYMRVNDEFKIATDKEYDILKKQLFSKKD